MTDNEKNNILGTIAGIAIEKKVFTQFSVIVLFIAGIMSFFGLGKLEDPDFTVKTALIMTAYPGATPLEVEKEISEPLEAAVQQMAEVKNIRSTNREGISIIKVQMKDAVPPEQMAQIWDILRKKVNDCAARLPKGAYPPQVIDDFGQVYGHVLALTAKGYSYHDIEHYAKEIKRKLSLVKDVSRVEIWGEQTEVLYVELNEAKIKSLGLSAETVYGTLTSQNNVNSAGRIKNGDARLRVEITGAFSSVDDIRNLLIHPSATDMAANKDKDYGSQIRLGDIADIYVSTIEPSTSIMRFNQIPAMAISISGVPGCNIADMGDRIKNEVAKIKRELPAGMTLETVAWQSDLIKTAISDFVINLIESLIIVIVILTIAMGWRMGLVIGGQLLLSILGTLIIMKLMRIELHRVSLGAFIIAMGMIVDNAIVIADGIFVRLQKGMEKIASVKEVVSANAWPLLGATGVAILAFYPVYGNDTSVGEYCAAMFMVIAISLLFSWILSITVAPLHTIEILAGTSRISSEKKGILAGAFTKALHWCMKNRALFLLLMYGTLILSCFSFRFVTQLFFPSSTRPQMMVYYYGQEGMDTDAVSKVIKQIENKMDDYKNISSYSTFIGQGSPRFYLPMEPEFPNQAYGEILLNLKSSTVIQETYDYLHKYVRENIPGITVIKKFNLGPGAAWQFELRIDGGVDASPEVLKSIASSVTDILKKCPLVDIYRTDWMSPVPKIKIDYDQKRGRVTAISRNDVIKGIRKSFDGITIGTYRKDDTLYPIIMRSGIKDRENLENLDGLQIYRSGTADSTPLDEVISNFRIEFEDPIIQRYNRHRMITVQARPIDGVTFPELQAAVIDRINQIKLPAGYSFYWDGEADMSKESEDGLKPAIPPAILMMLLIVMGLFNSYRPTLIIFMAIPFVVIGLVWGLLLFNAGFGFIAILGSMSLSGMMIKNGIVLLDEIEHRKKLQPENQYQALLTATQSRVRPVILAAGTTVLGCIPLLQDVFWESLAIVIMAGLFIGTVVTLLFVPVMYSLLYGIKNE